MLLLSKIISRSHSLYIIKFVNCDLTLLPGMAMDIERFNFKKILRDIQMHLDVGVKVHQSKRTPSDARFLEVFESLNHLLNPIKEHQQKISIGCAK